MSNKYTQLSIEERETIARLRAGGQSFRQISAALGRQTSTVSREIKRNSGTQVGYKAYYADSLTRGRRWQGSKMERDQTLQSTVLGLLEVGWSPEQISGRLRKENNGKNIISYESIYSFIYKQISRTKNYNWRLYLPQGRSKRRNKYSSRSKPSRAENAIKYRVSINKRSTIANDRAQFGHWEADLLHPRKNGAAILVLQERVSRYAYIAKIPTKQSEHVIQSIKLKLKPLHNNIKKSITQDNGLEFAKHYELNELGIETFFCDTHSPWQKGGVENLNGRIRKFIPRGTDPKTISEKDIDGLENILNNTPRKCLGFNTPFEIFHKKTLHFNLESTSPLSRG